MAIDRVPITDIVSIPKPRGPKMNLQQKRIIDGARAYAAADRSDPFAFNRAMSHMKNGISSVGARGEDAFYKAEPYQETRYLPDGREYLVTVYKNIQRP